MSILTALGIANTKYYPDFYTLNKIIGSINTFTEPVIECGVFKGRSLLGIAHALHRRGEDVKLYGLDSFKGLPEPSREDRLEDGTFHKIAQKAHYEDTSYRKLLKRIDRLGLSEKIIIIKGFFENTLSNLGDTKFQLVHLDCDLYESYKVCLEYLYDKVIAGGYIVIDDYKCLPMYPGAQKAVDEFFRDKPEIIECFNRDTHPRYIRYFVKKLRAETI